MSSRRIDPFYDKQPPLLFVEELKQPIHTTKPEWFARTLPREGEACVNGAYLVNEFPDHEKLLETAVEDFEGFLHVYEIQGSDFPIRLVKAQTECFEAYRIHVVQDGCTVEAEDTEGIRRALVFIEDEMRRREGALLPVGVISRKPVIRERITRGFFSPTNRPPKNIDELMDDIDYYPDEYLNRLAHDGTNGLWIYTYFNELLPSDYFTEYGRDSKKRIEKLKRVVAKCKRYGVKVWVFGVEPFAVDPQIAPQYRDCTGAQAWNGRYTVCTSSEAGAKYCIEATQKLMEMVPDLGGIIDITYGERPTTCASLTDVCQCERCSKYSRSEILARNIDLLKEGIRRAGTGAEFVSWTYAHRISPMEEIEDYVRRAPADVVLMENFEDAGFTEQLGKTRQAIDYWLSYVGPSQMFEGAAQTALDEGKRMFAKMQVCCSHELATVPYIPVPGILFDKYAAARKYRVEGVMQCWYFGNYPSMMSKAAGELAFLSDFSDKDGFLKELAGIYYGAHAQAAVSAWRHFENGYKNYPVNIMFSYYGPMHDGVVWELSLLPKDRALPRSWQLLDPPDGDRIGECLQSGHTLQEAVTLTQNMKSEWTEGIACLPGNGPKEQRDVIEALKLLFSSGNNILRFYELRELLAGATENADAILDEMEALVDAEIVNSREMILLCESDTRLGYHSEAEGYKFFPEKLEDRIIKLESLKRDEFTCVRHNLEEGNPLLPWYLGEEGKAYRMVIGGLKDASWVRFSDNASFRASYDKEKLYLELKGNRNTEFVIYFEFRPMWPAAGIIIKNDKIALTSPSFTHQSIFGSKEMQELEKYEIAEKDLLQGSSVLTVDRQKAGWVQDKPLRVRIAADGNSWIQDDDPVHTLGKPDTSPGEFGWLLPEGKSR